MAFTRLYGGARRNGWNEAQARSEIPPNLPVSEVVEQAKRESPDSTSSQKGEEGGKMIERYADLLAPGRHGPR